jgi:triacylglycerol esterase/lipase EstA (alpha/beta hydrolase family)
VSLLSGCNLGLQPRGVEPLPSSTGADSGAESSVSAGANTWLEWPTSSFDPVSPDNQPTPRWCPPPGQGGGYECGPRGGKKDPFDFHPVDSEKVATDISPQTDTAVSSGSFTINVPIRRFVGLAQTRGQAIANGTLSQKATIQLAFRTPDPVPLGCTGIDNWSINGHPLNPRLLESKDGWTLAQAQIPITQLIFPEHPGPGWSANNSIQIDANTNNCTGWGIEVDWAKIIFEAGPVIVLVHGINSTGSMWNDFSSRLTYAGIVSDNSITLPYATFPKSALRDPKLCNLPQFTSTEINATKIVDEAKRLAEFYGTGELAIASHSKGGMDSKAAITKLKNIDVSVGTTGSEDVRETVRVKSLVTINTPHLGTPAADLGILKTLEENKLTKKDEFNRVLGNPAWGQYFIQDKIMDYLLDKNYVCDLTTSKATKFNGNYPVPSQHTFGTNTNAATSPPNLSFGDVQDFGKSGFWGFVPRIALDVWQRLYTEVGHTQNIEFAKNLKGLYDVNWNILIQFTSNDILVSSTSAKGSKIPMVINEQKGIHHTEVVDDTSVQSIIVDKALKNTFGVDWSAK